MIDGVDACVHPEGTLSPQANGTFSSGLNSAVVDVLNPTLAIQYPTRLSAIREEGYTSFVTAAAHQAAAVAARESQGEPMWESRSWQGKSIYRSGWKWAV